MSAAVLINPYCTVRDVQREAQNTKADDVDVLTDAINKASRWIDGYCRRDFWFHDHTTTQLAVDPAWCALNRIYLPWPVITLTLVETAAGDRLQWDALDATEYVVETRPQDSRSRIVRTGQWIPADSFSNTLAPVNRQAIPKQIRLTGTFGYALASSNASTTPPASIPQEISTACSVIAAVRSGLWKKEYVDAVGSRQATTMRSVPKDVMEMLDRYKVAVV